MIDPTKFYAHSGDNDGTGWQLLADHLRQVAELAHRFAAEAFPSDTAIADAAGVAGLLHDLGKYRPEFQQMLRGISRLKPVELCWPDGNK